MNRLALWAARCGMAAAAFLAISAARASDDAVLLASTVPGYAPGMIFSGEDRLNLPEGATATLLFRSGQMLHMRGPFEGTLSGAPNPADPAAETRPFRLQGVDATVIGGTRAVRIPRLHALGTDVQVDPQRSETYCLRASDSVWIGRPADDGGQYALRRRGSVRAIAWPPGAARIAWPDDLLIEDGDQFEVMADGAAQATITFRMTSGRPVSDAARIADGILRGCRSQFDGLLRELARAVVPPELWLSSSRGRNPSYRPGEAVALTVEANTDGYLYCVLVRESGEAHPVFPAGAVDGAHLRGAEPLTLPGRRLGAVLHAGQKGTDRVRCWLADRDISPELPQALLGPAAVLLPDRVAADLDSVFRGTGGGRIATAELRLRVD